jgi:Sap, sulfolipid-1-addressing protein
VACDGGALEARCRARLINDLSARAAPASGPRRLGEAMLAQAVGYALLGAISPTALVISAIFLASANPRRAALFFLFGAALITVAMAVVLFLVLRAGGLSHPSERQPRYGLRLGLGVLALGVSLLLARRKPRAPNPDKKPNLVMRMASSPAPRAAFAVGVLVFTPSVTYVAAVQVIATSSADTAKVVLGLALVAAIDAMFAWLPLLLFLAAPEATTRRLKELDGWLHSHGHKLLVAAAAIAGLALMADGLAGLAGG